MRKLKLGLQDDFKEEIHFYDNVYSFMKGGLHTENKPKVFEADEDHLIIDWDVSSYYPAIIINNGKYPAHLGKEFLRGYTHMFEKRLELKPLAKNDKKIKGIVGALKLAVNSVYGKSSDMQSWIYDRQLTMFTTITGELSLMMLIEAYELQGLHVISANTVAPTAVQATSTTLGGNQYRVINSGSVLVFLGYGTDAATAQTNAANVATSLPLLAGTDEILSFVPNAYFSGVTASGNAVIYVSAGDGL